MNESVDLVPWSGHKEIMIIIVIIIIKRGRQCKTEREWYTPYQSGDPSPAIPTYWQKEDNDNIPWLSPSVGLLKAY